MSDDLRELAEKATPGPWRAVCLGSEGYAVWTEADGKTLRDRKGSVAVLTQRPFEECKADAELIAQLPALTASRDAALADLEAAKRDREEFAEAAIEAYGEQLRADLEVAREALREAVALLQWVRADRPSAHSDALWNEINDFLAARAALGES